MQKKVSARKKLLCCYSYIAAVLWFTYKNCNFPHKKPILFFQGFFEQPKTFYELLKDITNGHSQITYQKREKDCYFTAVVQPFQLKHDAIADASYWSISVPTATRLPNKVCWLFCNPLDQFSYAEVYKSNCFPFSNTCLKWGSL